MVRHPAQRVIIPALLAVALVATVPAAVAKTFRWASASDIPTWDIHSQNNALANGVHAAVYESLFYYSRTFELEPQLASGYKQLSPTQLRITLRPGIKFHDGKSNGSIPIKCTTNKTGQPRKKLQTPITPKVATVSISPSSRVISGLSVAMTLHAI